jgi:hypothetical protein
MATFADLHPQPQDATEPDIRWRTSRTDRTRLQHLSPVIGSQAVSDSTGRYQRRVVPVMAHPATTLTWRAVGDPNRIRDLLIDLPSIGSDSATVNQDSNVLISVLTNDQASPGATGLNITGFAQGARFHRAASTAATPASWGLRLYARLPTPSQPHRGLPAGAVICRQRAGIRCRSHLGFISRRGRLLPRSQPTERSAY